MLSNLPNTESKSTKPSGHSLTTRAGLTFISQTLLTTVRALSAFILTPIMLRSVGAELYGAWGMLNQLISYLSLSDLRPAGTLKYLLSNRQSESADVEEKQRLISIAIQFSLLSLPIFALLAYLAWSHLDQLLVLPPHPFADVQMAFGILIIGFFLDRILSIPSNILAAHNLGYAGTINSLLWICASLIVSYLSLHAGYGMTGLAAVTVIGLVGRSIAQMAICLRTLPWVAMRRPRAGESVAFVSASSWLSLSAIAAFLLTSADVLIVGILLDAHSAAIYSITALIPRAFAQLFGSLVSSGNAGLLHLLSSGKNRQLVSTRHDLHSIAVLVFGIGAPLLILLNDSFLRLWLGDGRSAGSLTTTLCVLLCAVQLFSRVDSVLLDGFGRIKSKAILQASAALLLAAFAPVATRMAGLNGLLLALVLANTLVAIIIRVRVHRHLCALDTAQEVQYHTRPTVVMCLIVLAALACIHLLPMPSSPLEWILQGTTALIPCSLITWRFALSQAERVAFVARLKHLAIR